MSLTVDAVDVANAVELENQHVRDEIALQNEHTPFRRET